MKLAELPKPQWDAANEAARCLLTADANREADRARFRGAVARLCIILPEEVDARAIIQEAARWNMLNDIAAICANIPTERDAA